MTAMEKYTGVRYATNEEVNNYNEVEAIFDKMDIDEVDKIIEIIGDYAHAYKSEEIRRTYRRAYYYAKKLGTTVKALVNWYFID